MIAFSKTDRTPTRGTKGAEFEKMLREAYEDREPRETGFADLAEANKTRDSLRKAANRLGIGLDMEILEESNEDGNTHVLVLQAREVRKQTGEKRGAKPKNAATDTTPADPYQGDDDSDDSEDDKQDEAPATEPAPAKSARPAPSVARPRVRQRT